MSIRNALFNTVAVKRPSSSVFDMTHDRKWSGRMGYLYPFLVKEALPGDSWSGSTDALLRFIPLLAPEMSRVRVCLDYFAVPYRLVWDETKDFFTKGRLGESSPVAPYWNLNDTTKDFTAKGLLCDYLGLPDTAGFTHAGNTKVSILPHRVYQLICDEYFRNQNLTPSFAPSKASGLVDGAELDKCMTLRKAHWGLDRFTSALPFAQRGDDVLIPVDVVARESAGDIDYKNAIVDPLGAQPMGTFENLQVLGPGAGAGTIHSETTNAGPVQIQNIDEIRSSNATFTMVDLRRAARLQEWLEKNALAGGRYEEQLKAHWGVISSDKRMQIPEYLGGGRGSMIISEVLSTVTDADIETVPPQGNMAGHGVAAFRSSRFRYFAEEHTFIMGIVRVLPYTCYQQGLDPMWTRFDVFDYPFPEFAHIGEQEILKREVYFDPSSAGDPTGLFGWTPRYSDWKVAQSSVHGDFKDVYDYWHMGRIFEDEQELNETFVTADPTERIFAVEGTDHLLCRFTNNVRVTRRLPYFGQGRL